MCYELTILGYEVALAYLKGQSEYTWENRWNKLCRQSVSRLSSQDVMISKAG
jgi:hypothetical protein